MSQGRAVDPRTFNPNNCKCGHPQWAHDTGTFSKCNMVDDGEPCECKHFKKWTVIYPKWEETEKTTASNIKTNLTMQDILDAQEALKGYKRRGHD